MLNWIHRRLRAQEGLTLIELIVVVAIIAILAFTITPRVLDALNNSKLNGARSVANEIHSALERYYANKGTVGVETYPLLSAATGTFELFRGEVEKEMGLPNNTTNVMADNGASPPVSTFQYFAYADEAAAGVSPVVHLDNTSTNPALWYCFHFQAKDREGTWFMVTPAGIEEDDTVNSGQCP